MATTTSTRKANVTTIADYKPIGSPLTRQIFDSLDDMLAEIVGGGNHVRHAESFVGYRFDTAQDIADMAQAAWEPGLDLIDRLTQDVADLVPQRPRSLRRRTRFSEDGGDDICLDRLRSAQPFWRSTVKTQSAAPRRLTIAINVSTASRVNWKDILYRGAAAIVLAKIMEAAGYRVQLWAVNIVTRAFAWKDGGLLTAVRLKQHGDPLDISTLTNAVSGWFFRSAFLDVYHSIAAPSDNHGMPRELCCDQLAELASGDPAIVASGIWSLDSAAQFVRSTLAEFI